MKRVKVVLYNPRAVFHTMPLGLVAVGSALDRSNVEVILVDGRLEADPVSAVLQHLDGAVCLGMGVLTGAPIRDALEVSRAVKARRAEIPVIWGGWHPSLFPEQCLEEKSIDAVVVGQGEETFAEIVERLLAGEALNGVAGCAHRLDGHVQLESTRPFRDINRFPRHDYALIPVERFFRLKGRRQLDYVSSQGCRFRCAFCADPFVYKRSWSGLSPARVVEELVHWRRLYPFEEVAFQDETFFTSNARVEELVEAILSAELAVEWTATLRADQGWRLSENAWARARRAGLKRVMIGMESGSQPLLDWMKKDITLEQVFSCAERCTRHGIGAIFNVIVGFPGEPDGSVRESLDVARRLRAMSPDFQVAIFYYWPYPGNEMAQHLQAGGYEFPDSLEAWAAFDYVGSVGPWVDRGKLDLVERFRFYQKHGFGPRPSLFRRPLRAMARWRVEKGWFQFPLEKAIVETFRPPQPVS